MANATGFLLRTSLSDPGTLPRSGSFTACPDIIPAGTTAISSDSLVNSYGTLTDKVLSQGLTNYLYVRAKNMNSTPLTQKVYLFQVDGSLVLHPAQWYTAQHLVGFDVRNPGSHSGDPDDPQIIAQYSQSITAQPNQIVATNAFTWNPDNTNHHCLVAVVADDWNAVLKNYNEAGTMDALAQWIYGNASMGWHNVNIQAITTQIYEGQIAYSHSKAAEQVTFTIVANNVPVGARVSFSSNTSTQSGQVIGQDWVNVSAPAGGGTINPDFEVGTTLTVNAGYTTIITYRTDFNGLAAPANFAMHMKATTTTTPPPSNNAVRESFAMSFHRAHSANAVFRDPAGNHLGEGIEGYRKMMMFVPGGDGDLDGDSGDLEDQVVVVIGSHTTTPVTS